jgi:hypothetical protein
VTDDSRPTGDRPAAGRVGDVVSPSFARGRLGDLNGEFVVTVLDEEEGWAAPRAGLRPGALVALTLDELLCTFCEEASARTKIRQKDSGRGWHERRIAGREEMQEVDKRGGAIG